MLARRLLPLTLLLSLVLGSKLAGAEPEPPPEAAFAFSVDSSEVPELKGWAEALKPVVQRWYPILVEYLPSQGYTAPKRFSITIRRMKGVAYTSGDRIVCAADWFKAHPDDVGAVIHELVHVVQQYPGRGNPGWLVEGVADYLRWIKYEPVTKRPRPNPDKAKYTDSYRTTAAFLEYVAANHEHEIVVRFNQAMREGRYSPDLWKQYTGKTVEELWSEYIETLRKA
jgi:hypothetical protein